MSTLAPNTQGVEDLKREFSDDELMDGIDFDSKKTEVAATFTRVAVPSDEEEHTKALYTNFAKTDAILEKIKSLVHNRKI